MAKDADTIAKLEKLQADDGARSTQYACRCALAALRGDNGLPPDLDDEVRGKGPMEEF
mgnify:CR=1 FL=1